MLNEPQMHSSQLNPRQKIIVAVLLSILVVDGMDVGVLSVAAPKIIAEWQSANSDFGIALSAAPAGMAIGSVVGGWLGDRLGRKAVLIGSMAIFGLATMLSAFVTGVPMLSILRLLGGIGFGAASPSAVALATEWMPSSHKSRIGSLMSVGAPLGVMLASYIGLLLLSAFGWRGTFMIFGLLTFIIGILSAISVPESAAFLSSRGRDDKARKFAKRVLGDAALAPSAVREGTEEGRTTSFFSIRGMWRFNAGIWLAFFASAYVTYAIANWLPVILGGLGFGFDAAVRGLFCMTSMALAGTTISGWLVDRFGSRRMGQVISVAAFVFSLCFYAIALQGNDYPAVPLQIVIYMLCAGLGLTQGSIAGVLFGLVSVRYPVMIRSTGIGIAMMVAKVGGVFAVLAGGWLLDSRHNPQALVILTFAGAALILGASIALIDRHISGRVKLGDRFEP